MSDTTLRSRSVAELVDAAFQLYRRDAAQYMLLVAIAYLPWVALQLLLDDAAEIATGSGTGTLIGYLGTALSFAFMSAVLIRYSASRYLNEPADVGAALRDVAPRLPSVLLAGLLRYVTYMVGLLLFIVGMFYFIARYFAVVTAIILERKGVMEAFGRSSQLSKGRKRHIINAYLLIGIIYLVGSLAMTFLAGLAGPRASVVAAALFTVVAYPAVGILEMLLYYDTRVREEGYDLERMVDALDAPTAARAG